MTPGSRMVPDGPSGTPPLWVLAKRVLLQKTMVLLFFYHVSAEGSSGKGGKGDRVNPIPRRGLTLRPRVDGFDPCPRWLGSGVGWDCSTVVVAAAGPRPGPGPYGPFPIFWARAHNIMGPGRWFLTRNIKIRLFQTGKHIFPTGKLIHITMLYSLSGNEYKHEY